MTSDDHGRIESGPSTDLSPDRRLEAAIFDMDGLLTESESRWRQAELEIAASVGLDLSVEDLESTMGMRMTEVAEHWYQLAPWSGPSTKELATQVVDRVIELTADAVCLPGVENILDLVADQGLRVALCSSSDRRLIDATLARLGLTSRFSVVHSAEFDRFGKPHPEPYIRTAKELGIRPSTCVVFEDSLNGCISGRAAGMNVVAVPDTKARGDARFGFCDLVLESLEWFDAGSLATLDRGQTPPTTARSRFHLAFPVADLAEARRFYGGILGAPEGRSSAEWVDFDLWGHQIVAHLDPEGVSATGSNNVDGHAVPIRHFGLVLHRPAWNALVTRLRSFEVPFLIEPHTRFAGQPGEQDTCFVRDPSGNALEFKAFVNDQAVFATH